LPHVRPVLPEVGSAVGAPFKPDFGLSEDFDFRESGTQDDEAITTSATMASCQTRSHFA
jgi:hypothetical protein